MSIEDFSPRLITRASKTVPERLRITPLDYRHPRLAAQLADALEALRATGNLSDGTAYHYKRSITALLSSLPASLPATVSLSSPGPECLEAFFKWEAALLERHGPRSTVPKAFGRRIRHLIRGHHATGRPLSAPVKAWAEGPTLHGPGSSQPLDEFSNAERIAIRDHCRTVIRELEKRQRVGQALLAQGTDPRVGGWDGPNTMWALANLGRPGQVPIGLAVFEADVFPDDPRYTPRHVSIATRIALSYLYPERVDLVAFRALLQLATGAAPEEWTGVTLADLDLEDEVVRVRLRKTRAHRSRTIQCPVTPQRRGEGWKSGDLVLRLLAATSLGRQELRDETTSPLFITVLRDKARHLCARRVDFDRREFSELIAAIDTPISGPHDSRRLRKTVKSVRAAVLRSIDVAADDNMVAVFHRHYAQSTTVHVLAGEAVTTAQSQVLDRLREGPTLVTASAHELTTAPDPLVAAAATTATAASITDRAMGPATCTDPYDSPYTLAGRLCEHRPSMCFACPNAIVFADHLPRLLAYREILEDQRRELAPQHFAATHGQQLLNIEAILSQFTPEQIERATNELTQTSQIIHVPLGQRGTHL